MTDQRSGEDRRLASQKQTELTGGNVNYYLTDLGDGTVVENEDVIELLRMPFNIATTFKSTTRLCKLRMDLGKPGSTRPYEVGKVGYYNKRAAADTNRRESTVGFFWNAFRTVRDFFNRHYFDDINEIILEVKDPKRLNPYSFRIGKYLDALQPSAAERCVLENNLKLALMRLVIGPPRKDEVMVASVGIMHADYLDRLEKIDATAS